MSRDVVRRRIAVTGAAGLVGRAVVERLRSEGHDVVPLIRPGGRRAPGGVAVDLGDGRGLCRALDGCDAVVHAAARMTGDAESIQHVNVAGTRSVVEACRSTSVRRVVLLSTVAVYGDGDMVDVDESREPTPTSPYGRSKVEAEHLVLEAGGAVIGCVLRPTTVWSPSDEDGFTSFVLALGRDGVIPLCRGGSVRFDLVGAGDLAQACVLAATAERRGAGSVLHVTSGEGMTIRDVVERLRTLGLPARTADVTDPDAPPIDVSAELVAAVAEHRHFRIDRVQGELGYEPVERFPSGLEQRPEVLAARSDR